MMEMILDHLIHNWWILIKFTTENFTFSFTFSVKNHEFLWKFEKRRDRIDEYFSFLISVQNPRHFSNCFVHFRFSLSLSIGIRFFSSFCSLSKINLANRSHWRKRQRSWSSWWWWSGERNIFLSLSLTSFIHWKWNDDVEQWRKILVQFFIDLFIDDQNRGENSSSDEKTDRIVSFVN